MGACIAARIVDKELRFFIRRYLIRKSKSLDLGEVRTAEQVVDVDVQGRP